MNYKELVRKVTINMGLQTDNLGSRSFEEVEFAANEAIKRLAEYTEQYVKEITISATDVTDTYAIDQDVSQVKHLAIDGETYLSRTTATALPTDGSVSEPRFYAAVESGPTLTDRMAVVLYPSPDKDYSIIATCYYTPSISYLTPDVVIPIPEKYDYPLVMFCCYYMSMRPNSGSSVETASRYEGLAINSVKNMAVEGINDEAMWGRGYFDANIGATQP